MKPCTFLRAALAIATALTLALPAEAQLFRSYLAIDGNDANPCTLPQPCRLLPAALAAVASGGEVWLLDSANYNNATVNVTKSVTILAIPGAVGSIVATGGPAVRIATAGVEVALRNLVMVPLPGGGATSGIVMTAGTALAVDGCLVANMPESGIDVTGDASVRITGTTIRRSGTYGIRLYSGPHATIVGSVISDGSMGVYVIASAAGSSTSAEIADSTFDANNVGVYVHAFDAAGTAKASLHQSRLVRNSYGAYALSNAGGIASVAVGDSLVSGNEHGVYVLSSGSTAWLSGSTISHNVVGIQNNGAAIESAGNNAVRKNGTNVIGIITPVAPM